MSFCYYNDVGNNADKQNKVSKYVKITKEN